MQHYFTNNENLKSKLIDINYQYLNYHFKFTSDNGLFSKNKIDYGSSLLCQTYLKQNPSVKTILDVGCGYGFIGIVLAKVLKAKADLIDVNKRAIHLSVLNIKKQQVDAQAFESNVYENVTSKYDLIISNPPIRAGKKVVLDILLTAKDHLNSNGEVWFVMRKDQGLKSINAILKATYDVWIMNKDKGFYVVKLRMK